MLIQVERIRTQKKWALVDHMGAVVAVTGGLFINAATYIEVKQVRMNYSGTRVRL